MPDLVLYSDLSPSLPFNFWALAAGLQQDIPLWSQKKWNIPAHQALWTKAKELSRWPGEFGRPCAALINGIRRQAGSSADIVLLGNAATPIAYSYLLTFLRKLPELKNYNFRAVICLGRQDLVLEQCIRANFKQKISSTDLLDCKNQLGNPEQLPKLLVHSLGRENVILLKDSADDACPSPSTDLQAKIFSSLGKKYTSGCVFPPHPLRLRSRSARAIMQLLMKMRNAHPHVDMQACFATLQELEASLGWDDRPLSPPEIRTALLQQCAEGNNLLAQEFFMKPELFAATAQERKSQQEQWQEYAGLASKEFDSFLEAAPSDVSKLLRQGLMVDADLFERWFDEAERKVVAKHSKPIRQKLHPKVAVLTMACNQEAYIAECIESILAQQTNFPVEHVIIDHASTDCTPKIISSYAQKHKNIRPMLLRSKKAGGECVSTLFSMAHAPFAALCDGDDYYTDPLKLQRQVDFLEKNPDAALCFHPVHVRFEDNAKKNRVFPDATKLPGGIRKFYFLPDLLSHNFIQTNSVMYRWRFPHGLPPWFDATVMPGDWYWHLLHAENGAIGFINEPMSVYRRHKRSLYYASETSSQAVRLQYCLCELKLYTVVDRHFNGKFSLELQKLVNGVFGDLLRYSQQSGDNEPLQVACKQFPTYANKFLDEIKNT